MKTMRYLISMFVLTNTYFIVLNPSYRRRNLIGKKREHNKFLDALKRSMSYSSWYRGLIKIMWHTLWPTFCFFIPECKRLMKMILFGSNFRMKNIIRFKEQFNGIKVKIRHFKVNIWTIFDEKFSLTSSIWLTIYGLLITAKNFGWNENLFWLSRETRTNFQTYAE